MSFETPVLPPMEYATMSDTAPYYEDHRPRRKPWLAYALVVIGLVAVALIGKWFAGAGAQKNARSGRPAAAVSAVPVGLGDMPVEVNAIGTVTPIDSAAVRSQLSGTVFAILFKEGQQVREGQVIAQIDPRPYRLSLAQAEGTLAKDMAQLNSAKLDLKRYETLASQDSVARQTLDTQRATVGQLEGTVSADRAAVGTAKLNLQYTAVKAPFSGRIGLRQVSVGAYVTPSDTAGIATITRTDPIDVAFTVPQGQLNAIAAKGSGLPVIAYDQDGKSELAKGTFSTFDNQIDTTTGTVKAKARFANPAAVKALFPNQFVNVKMLVDTLHQVPVVPVSALRHGAPGDFVFVVQPDKKVKLTVVKVGPSDGRNTAVLSGLSKGQMVVAEGADGLDDGSTVRLAGSGGPGGAGEHKGKRKAAQ
ncbi:multidrug efflux system membrane fusion protein [Novosphingobium sp. SG751A]|uniref:efflux RND transporter periplasmic adaptor subunit n=1 Tax=Novosphingobium sp. SG751A TaxID=2587000 RepID=UPI0020A6B641|nr:efflux RND transporter periplasmic adaptor subunit [Novosphingobium sp. SG751A]NOW46047.1 multidrug efflux system membrane fusion protein [Novosphingobium sp. SG751A]